MEADPKHMAGRFLLGRILVKQGRLAEARKLRDRRTSDTDDTFPQFIELLKRAENLRSAAYALAKKPDELDEYRKNYVKGIIAKPVRTDQ